MDRKEQIRIVKRLLQFIQSGTTVTAPHQLTVDVAEYSDADLWEREVEAFYKSMPIAVGMSCELPGPGAYKALEVCGVPVLLVRDGDGCLKAFLNVCRHRGAPVAAGCGVAARFSCPYHGWTYDRAGRLVGVSCEDAFGPVDRASRSLRRLPCAERAGVIFAGLTPGMPFDIDAFLSGADKHIAGAEPQTLYYGGERRFDMVNWKIVMEGYLESYHFSTLHKNSIGATMFGNCSMIEYFGPHVLTAVPHKNIFELVDRPESEWQPLRDGMFTAHYVLFPGTSVTLMPNAMMTQMVRPAGDVGSSTNTLMVGFYEPASDAAKAAEDSAFFDFIDAVLVNEDYAIVSGIQKGMTSGAQSEVILGRNEPGVIYFHETMRETLAR